MAWWGTTSEAGALARLAAHAVATTSGRVREMHEAIASRVFTATGPGAQPVRAAHDAIAGVVYASVRGGSTAVGAVTGAALDAYPWPAEGRVVSGTKAGGLALSALNGFVGDHFEDGRSPLRVDMSVRVGGVVVPPSRGELARAFPAATGKIAVFVHGLCCSEQVWWRSAAKHYGDPAVSYGSRLAEEFGYTPVYLRYNTGLHISENGRRLASLLADVTGAWPVEVQEIALIGHSMGGLVARSACHAATTSGLAWPRLVRHSFSLGSPHTGAPLEQAANAASWALAAVPETRPVAKVLNVRSCGIKDLRYGYLRDEDWTGYDCDALLQNRRGDIPLLAGATHYFVGVTLTSDPRHPVGRILGDLVVLLPSASGIARDIQRIPFEMENGRHFGRMHHLGVLNHPEVYAQLADWLGSDRSVVPPHPTTATFSPGAGE